MEILYKVTYVYLTYHRIPDHCEGGQLIAIKKEIDNKWWQLFLASIVYIVNFLQLFLYHRVLIYSSLESEIARTVLN